MKYDIDLERQGANTSHAQVLDLVGTGRRVLDVGCSTGYLAAALKERGNRVTGIEIDPEAGERARPHLERLVIGDLQTMDLAAELGEHAFDVVVFADVLEHLTDPLAVLRQAPSLLAPGGSVVVSIPNVAHGAVRLALLAGRFEYRDVGLLDETHLRFFTRSSVEELHRLAGLEPVDQRRTVAGPFDTEIPLEADDFAAPVVERVLADPEATAYQFVIRSIPTDQPRTGDLGTDLVAREQQVNELRQRLARASQAAPRTHPPILAVVAAVRGDDPFDELRRVVVAHELGRRLPGWELRAHQWGGEEPRPAPDGSPVFPFQLGGPQPSADQVDCAVLAGSWSAAAVRDASSAMGERGCPVHVAGIAGCSPAELPQVRPPGSAVGWAPDDRLRAVPDPLLLAGRAAGEADLAQRASVLRSLELVPATGDFVLVNVASGPAAAVGRALDTLAEDRSVGLAVVADRVTDPGGALAKAVGAESSRATVTTEGLEAVDLLAAVASSSLVVTDRAELLWAAVGLGRPCVGLDLGEGAEPATPKAVATLRGWLGDPDLWITTPAALPGAVPLAQRRSAQARVHEPALDDLELFLDELASAIAATGTRRLSMAWPARMAEADQRADALQVVNRGLQRRLRKQQAAFADVARLVLGAGGSSVSSTEHRAMADRLARADAEVARLQAEVADLTRHIQATEATLTMRTLAPARRLYGRLRRL